MPQHLMRLDALDTVLFGPYCHQLSESYKQPYKHPNLRIDWVYNLFIMDSLCAKRTGAKAVHD